MNQHSPPPEPSTDPGLPNRRTGLSDAVVGLIGSIVIGVTLFGVRVWARLTRTPYYGD